MDSPARTITVTGEGKESVKPDMALVVVGVMVTAPALADAAAQADGDMRSVLGALRSLGLGADDVQTTQLEVAPQRNFQTGALEGYSVSNGVRVTVRELDRLGRVLATVVAANAGVVHSLRFRVADQAAVEQRARRSAAGDARSRAQAYAEQLGVALGAPLQISEQATSAWTGGGGGGLLGFGSAGAGAQPDAPVASGLVEVSAQVQVVFALE